MHRPFDGNSRKNRIPVGDMVSADKARAVFRHILTAFDVGQKQKTHKAGQKGDGKAVQPHGSRLIGRLRRTVLCVIIVFRRFSKFSINDLQCFFNSLVRVERAVIEKDGIRSRNAGGGGAGRVVFIARAHIAKHLFERDRLPFCGKLFIAAFGAFAVVGT